MAMPGENSEKNCDADFSHYKKIQNWRRPKHGDVLKRFHVCRFENKIYSLNERPVVEPQNYLILSLSDINVDATMQIANDLNKSGNKFEYMLFYGGVFPNDKYIKEGFDQSIPFDDVHIESLCKNLLDDYTKTQTMKILIFDELTKKQYNSLLRSKKHVEFYK